MPLLTVPINPQRILLVGDLHAHAAWVSRTLLPLVDVVQPDLIIQLGDFGFWPRRDAGRSFLTMLEHELGMRQLHLWWVDGNHEDHDALNKLPVNPATGLRSISGHVHHVPRGSSWCWGSKRQHRWLAIGGAASVDAAWRTPGWGWFPSEAVTDADVALCSAEGHADVVVAHDFPWGTPTWAQRFEQHLPAEERSAPWPTDALRASDANEKRLRQIFDAVQPTFWFHGHHHMRVTDQLGEAAVIGLRDSDQPAMLSTLLVGPSGKPFRRQGRR